MSSKASILALIDSTRHQLGFGRDRSFVPTANVRNPHMLEEAEAFSLQLKELQRAVHDYHRSVQGFMRKLLPLLDSNLPRVWTAVPETVGLAEPVRAAISHGHPSRIGGDFDAAAIIAHMDILDRSIGEEILAPLRRWQEGLQVARERMKSLDHLRREVDGQRKKFEKKFYRAEQKLRRAYLGAGYGSSSSSDSDGNDIVPRGKLLEDYQRLALHTERQLRAIIESYDDQERLVWEQLSGLVTDAAWLESYAAAAMIKVKEAMQGVALALGPSKQPLPAYRPKPGVPTAVPYGEVGSNLNQIKQMSPRAMELASGAIPRHATILPYQPLRAKRGTATPLLVAAAAAAGNEQRLLAAEPVPPVQLGASGVPMNMVPDDVAHRAMRDVERRAAGEGIAVHSPPPVLLPAAAAATTASTGPSPTAAAAAMQPSPNTYSTTPPSSISPIDLSPTAYRGAAGLLTGFSHKENNTSKTLGLGSRDVDADRAGIRDQDVRESGFSADREPSLAMRDMGFSPQGYGARTGRESDHSSPMAAAAASPGVNGISQSNAVRLSGSNTPVPFSKMNYDGDHDGVPDQRAIRDPADSRMDLRLAAAANGVPNQAAAAANRELPMGNKSARSDDVLDSFVTPVKVTSPADINAIPTDPSPVTSHNHHRDLDQVQHPHLAMDHALDHNHDHDHDDDQQPQQQATSVSTTPRSDLARRSITDAIRGELAESGSWTTQDNNVNNRCYWPLTPAPVTSPAYPPAARVSGEIKRERSGDLATDSAVTAASGRDKDGSLGIRGHAHFNGALGADEASYPESPERTSTKRLTPEAAADGKGGLTPAGGFPAAEAPYSPVAPASSSRA